jgi:hypothetical protein
MSVIENRINHIHHNLNHISGGMVYAITKRRLIKSETLEWARMMRAMADELEEIANGKATKSYSNSGRSKNI